MAAFSPHAVGDMPVPTDQWVMVIPHIGRTYPEHARYDGIQVEGVRRGTSSPIKIFASQGNIALRPSGSLPAASIPAEGLGIQLSQGRWHVDDLPESMALYARALLIPGTDASVHVSC